MALTQDQINLLKQYLKLINIKNVYSLTTSEPVTWNGKIVNISGVLPNNKKVITIDVPVSDSTKSEINNIDITNSTNTISYNTSILRFTIELTQSNIDWLLSNVNDLDSLLKEFFNIVKEQYIQTQQVPNTLKTFIGKTF